MPIHTDKRKRTPKAILTVGIPGCGKSTWAQTQVGFEVLECDRLREIVATEMGLSLHAPEVSAEAWVRWERKLQFLLRHKADILVSDTNVHAEFRDALVTRLQRHGYEVVYELWPATATGLRTALERNAMRVGDRRIPEDIVRAFHQALAEQTAAGAFGPYCPVRSIHVQL